MNELNELKRELDADLRNAKKKNDILAVSTILFVIIFITLFLFSMGHTL